MRCGALLLTVNEHDIECILAVGPLAYMASARRTCMRSSH